MAEEEVAAGAHELVVILAYLEIARANDKRLGKTATHLGFWSLAKEWNRNNIINLPRELVHPRQSWTKRFATYWESVGDTLMRKLS